MHMLLASWFILVKANIYFFITQSQLLKMLQQAVPMQAHYFLVICKNNLLGPIAEHRKFEHQPI